MISNHFSLLNAWDYVGVNGLLKFCWMILAKARLRRILTSPCKCAGSCYGGFDFKDVKSFLDTFEGCSKREQDTILYMACETDSLTLPGRREYIFLKQPIKRVCFQALIGVSSHWIDKIGDIDQRYKDAKKPQRPSPLAASVDAFCMVVYNSIAEPLPDRTLGPQLNTFMLNLMVQLNKNYYT